MEEVIPTPAQVDPRVSVGRSSIKRAFRLAHAFDHDPRWTVRDGEMMTLEHGPFHAVEAVT